MKKPLQTATQHSMLDLYYQALRVSHELGDIQNYIVDRKKSLDLILKRFQDIHQIEQNDLIDTDTFFIKLNANSTKRQTKEYKKYLRKISKI